MLQVQPVEQPTELLFIKFDDRTFQMDRPLEPLLLKALQPKAKTSALPIKHFDLVAPLVDEAEQIATERIKRQRRFDQHREPVNTLAKIDRLATQVDRDIARCR